MQKKITVGIWLIFRGLFFEHIADIGQKDHLWMDNSTFYTCKQTYLAMLIS